MRKNLLLLLCFAAVSLEAKTIRVINVCARDVVLFVTSGYNVWIPCNTGEVVLFDFDGLANGINNGQSVDVHFYTLIDGVKTAIPTYDRTVTYNENGKYWEFVMFNYDSNPDHIYNTVGEYVSVNTGRLNWSQVLALVGAGFGMVVVPVVALGVIGSLKRGLSIGDW